MSASPFSHVVRVERIPARGKHVVLEASEAEREAIAKAIGIVAVEALSAELELSHGAGGDVRVRGVVRATVVQTDVVTLDPLRQEVAEEVDVSLSPAEGGRARRTVEAEEPAADERDTYERGEIDVGAIAVEHVALGLDPYPRAAGVEFEGHVEDMPAETESPFAVLRRLKPEE